MPKDIGENMQKIEDVMAKLDHIEQDVAEVRKALFIIRVKDKEKAETAWKNLLAASELVSKNWKGLSAVEEIREQRSKAW